MLRGVLVRRWGIREHRFFGAEANRCGEAQQWQQSRLVRLTLTALICKPSRPHRVHRAQSSFYLICALFSTALAFSFSLFYIHTYLLLYNSTVHYIPVLAVPSACYEGVCEMRVSSPVPLSVQVIRDRNERLPYGYGFAVPDRENRQRCKIFQTIPPHTFRLLSVLQLLQQRARWQTLRTDRKSIEHRTDSVRSATNLCPHGFLKLLQSRCLVCHYLGQDLWTECRHRRVLTDQPERWDSNARGSALAGVLVCERARVHVIR